VLQLCSNASSVSQDAVVKFEFVSDVIGRRVYRAIPTLHNRGNARNGLNDFESAIADFHRAIQLNPKNSYAYIGQAQAWISLKNLQGALADANQAIELNLKNAEGYVLREVVQRRLKNYQRTLADANQAIKLNPQLAQLLRNARSYPCHTQRHPWRTQRFQSRNST